MATKAFDIWQKGRRGFSSQGRVWKDGLEGVLTPYSLKMTCGFLIQPLICKLCGYVWYVLSAVHLMLLPSQKPSSYSLLNFVQVTRQLRQSLVLYCGEPPPKKNPGSTKKRKKMTPILISAQFYAMFDWLQLCYTFFQQLLLLKICIRKGWQNINFVMKTSYVDSQQD